jgi:LEA14-like dessication related protein
MSHQTRLLKFTPLKCAFIGSARRAAVLVFSLGMLGACTTLPPPNLLPPDISVAEIGLKDFGLSEVRFEVLLEARNPNDVDVPLTNMRADLELFGTPFATGVVPAGTVYLPRHGSQWVPLEFRVSTLRVLDSVRQARGMDWSKLSYKIRGSSNWAGSALTIPFQRDGSLEVIKRAIEVFGPLGR